VVKEEEEKAEKVMRLKKNNRSEIKKNNRSQMKKNNRSQKRRSVIIFKKHHYQNPKQRSKEQIDSL
jgi:hypothetical protein